MRALIIIGLGLVLFIAFDVAFFFAWRAHENARGAREWNETLAQLRSRGEPTDFQALIPPSIPNADNLAAIPLLELQPNPPGKELEPLKLNDALKNIADTGATLPEEHWLRGKYADPAELAKFLAAHYHSTFRGQELPASLLDQFDALCPAISDLRVAALARNGCLFDRDYVSYPPFNRALGGVTRMIKLARVLDLHGIEALRSDQAAIALQDVEVGLKLDSGLRQEPILVSGLVAVGVISIQLGTVWEGLELHAWSDSQLASLQREMARIDFLSDDQLCLRGEALGFFAPTMDYLGSHHAKAASLILGMSAGGEDRTSLIDLLMRGFWSITPNGWLDSTKAHGVTLFTEAARKPVDVQARRVFPQESDSLVARAKKNPGLTTLPEILLKIATGPVIGCTNKFAQGQCRVDLARVACMIERYRLAHNSLPASLDQLAPYTADGAGMPHDLFSGEPLRYARNSNGTYRLYSVGWNQTDEGGTVDFLPDDPKHVDTSRGDWVWPQPGSAGT